MEFSKIVGNLCLGKAFGGGGGGNLCLGTAFGGGGGEAFAGSGGGGEYPRRQGPTRGIHTASWKIGSSRVTTRTHDGGEPEGGSMLSNSYSDGRRQPVHDRFRIRRALFVIHLKTSGRRVLMHFKTTFEINMRPQPN